MNCRVGVGDIDLAVAVAVDHGCDVCKQFSHACLVVASEALACVPTLFACLGPVL